MGNVNTVAVGVLADVSCVILCEGIHLDDTCLQKAKDQDVYKRQEQEVIIGRTPPF